MMVFLAMFSAGIALALAALYVYFRDMSYLWQIASQVWFFATPIVYSEEYEYILGKAIQLREGSDIAIIANGSMVARSLSCADLLEKEQVSVSVFNFHTIKPLDIEVLSRIATKHRKVIIVEEHSVVGGLGGAIAEHWIAYETPPQVRILGLPDYFGKTGEYEFLLERYGLTASGIAASIREFL